MISYSPNMMGPRSHWYEKNNVPFVHIPFVHVPHDIKRYTPQYATGRIDIWGDEPWQEFNAPIMEMEDWNKLHDFCDEFESEKQLNEEEFFAEFTLWLGREIKWYK